MMLESLVGNVMAVNHSSQIYGLEVQWLCAISYYDTIRLDFVVYLEQQAHVVGLQVSYHGIRDNIGARG